MILGLMWYWWATIGLGGTLGTYGLYRLLSSDAGEAVVLVAEIAEPVLECAVAIASISEIGA